MATKLLFAALLLSSTALAHIEMTFPPPFRSQYNPHVISSGVKVDYDVKNNIDPTFEPMPHPFPCMGYTATDLGTPAGASVATFQQGSEVNITLLGTAIHDGGSCQVSISTDKGKTWFVIQSFQGGCLLNEHALNVTIPSDAPIGDAVFAWSWFNNLGKREMYMNCAAITITAGSGPAPSIPFADRPDLLVANLENGCNTVENNDVLIPNPGPDVVFLDHLNRNAKDENGNPAPPRNTTTAPLSGICAPVSGIGGRKSSSSPAANNSTKPSSTASVTTTSTIVSQEPYVSATVLPTARPSVSPAVGNIGDSPFAIALHVPSGNGVCGGVQTCNGQELFGKCCSKWGYCGNTADHCGDGCQSGFGDCTVLSMITITPVADYIPPYYPPTDDGVQQHRRGKRARHVRQFAGL